MSAVRYEAVEKRFGSVAAIRALDLDIPDHAFLALLGPSGCGKTTALRILAGLELPTGGRVLIGGRDVTRLQPRDRDVAMVFQSYALYPHLKIAENIAYPLRILKIAPAERARMVAEVAAALEVGHLLDRYPRQLSGGQRQRIALARAIVREPAAFLMDEPLSNLDARLRLTMRGEIKRLCQRLGTTTLYVTHDQAEALTMADLIAVMRDGDLQQVALPDEIYARPANRFVATFVGNPPMNVLRASVDEAGLQVAGATLPLDARRRDECRAAVRQGDGYPPRGRTPRRTRSPSCSHLRDLRRRANGQRNARRSARRRRAPRCSSASRLRGADRHDRRRRIRSRRCVVLRRVGYNSGASFTKQGREQ